MKLLNRFVAISLCLPFILVASARAQNQPAADLVFAVELSNGNSQLHTYLNNGLVSGSWTQAAFGGQTPGHVRRMTQDSRTGTYYTLNEIGSNSFSIYSHVTPHLAGYGTVFPSASTNIFNLTGEKPLDIWLDRSLQTGPNGISSLVVLSEISGVLNLRRLSLQGAVIGGPTSLGAPLPGDAGASLAIDPRDGTVFVGTGHGQLGAVNRFFTGFVLQQLRFGSGVSVGMAVTNMSWDNRGLGAAEYLTVAGVEQLPSGPVHVVRRFNANGVTSASAAILQAQSAFLDMAVSSNGHVYLMQKDTLSGRVLNHIDTTTHQNYSIGAVAPALASATSMVFSSRVAVGEYDAATPQNLVQRSTGPVYIGDQGVGYVLSTLQPPAGQPLPGIFSGAVMNFSSQPMFPELPIPGLGTLLVDVGAPGYTPVNVSIQPWVNNQTRWVGLATPTWTPAENGLSLWCQILVNDFGPTYLTDTASTFTVGYRPVE